MAQFVVQLSKGETVSIDQADAYQFEGPLTTFFSTGSSRQVIDSWSTRVASYRTADVLSIERFDMVLPLAAGDAPIEVDRAANDPAANDPAASDPAASEAGSNQVGDDTRAEDDNAALIDIRGYVTNPGLAAAS